MCARRSSPVKWRAHAYFSGKRGKPDQTDPAEQFFADRRLVQNATRRHERADLLLLIVRSLVATIGAAYFVVTGFIQPALHHRDRLWCERWTGLAFGVIAIAVGSVLISILEKKGP